MYFKYLLSYFRFKLVIDLTSNFNCKIQISLGIPDPVTSALDMFTLDKYTFIIKHFCLTFLLIIQSICLGIYLYCSDLLSLLESPHCYNKYKVI